MLILNKFRKIDIFDEAGNEITEITVPIPFVVQIQLEERPLTRYRVRLIDDNGNNRGHYIGTTGRKNLNLNVPLIKLPRNSGKLRILVEESSGDAEYTEKHQVTITYLDYKNEAIKMGELPDKLLEPPISTNKRMNEIENVKPKASAELAQRVLLNTTELAPLVEIKKIKKKKKKISSPWVSIEELEYLNKRKSILKEYNNINYK